MAAESKTEKATPKKRRDERKKGNIFQSNDIVNAFSILGIFFTLKLIFPFVYAYLSNFMLQYFSYIKNTNGISEAFAMNIYRDGVLAVVMTAGPVMLAAMGIGIIAAGAQTRFLFSYESMKMKFNRLSPMQGIKRSFSLRSAVELVKSIIKAVIIGFILYNGFSALIGNAIRLMSIDIMQAVIFILNTIMDMIIQLSLVFIGLAGFDYFYQWWEHERSLKMTKQEVKEEYKHTEGDPQIKGKIRDTQRRMAMQRMMQQVPSADVVVRNPTHFAVALKYDVDSMRAPIVVAKGQDTLALRIIAVAEENNVPVMEDRPLARALYAEVECGFEIPAEYYSVLAEIMAWVYSLRKGESKVEV